MQDTRLQSLAMEARWLATRTYPAFVTARQPAPLDARAVPAFIFHGVEPERFEQQMRFLAENRYHTLDADEMAAFLAGTFVPPPASVMLTFDDGERSLYRVAFPLLRRYGFKAVVFLVPAAMRDTPAPASSGKEWLSWPEVKELQSSGHVDCQSHTWRHERMFVESQRVDFVRPGVFVDGLGVDNPVVRDGAQDRRLVELGAPIYRMAPRMGDLPKYVDSEAVRGACSAHVLAHGGADFFSRPEWRRELRAVFDAARNRHGDGRIETPAEQRAAILEGLARAREMLQAKLGKDIVHVAYPWSHGGALSVALSREAGYRTNFWGPIRHTRLNRPGQDPFFIARLKDDYLMRLPGRGRESLADVFLLKLRRRRAHRDIY